MEASGGVRDGKTGSRPEWHRGGDDGIIDGVGILGRIKFLLKFRMGVRGSGKVEVGGKRWFVGNRGGRVAKREAAASTEEIDYRDLKAC